METNTNNIIIYISGLIIGLTFPDFDYFFEHYIGHRSFITHSIIILLIFLSLSKHKADFKKINYLLGLSNGLIIHLISDLDLPSELVGDKTIKFFTYDFGLISFYWLMGNIVIGFYIAEKLLKTFDNKKKYYLINLIFGCIFIYLYSDIYLFLIALLIILSFIFLFLRKSLS